jgi:hypothetical protein
MDAFLRHGARAAVLAALILVTLGASRPAVAQTPATSAPAPEPRPHWTDKLKLSGFLQAQLVTNASSRSDVDAQGAPLNRDRFEVRRARLKLTYTADPAEGVLHIDALPSGFRLLEAEVSGKLVWVGDAYTKLTAGLFRIPFGYELQGSMSVHPFPERSIWASRMFPGVRDLGVRIWGASWNEALVYQLALQNGQPIGDAAFPGVDPNGFKDLTARLGTKLGPLRAGVSGLLGRGFLAPALDDAATPEDETHRALEYDRWAAGADLVLAFDLPALGELGLFVEAAYAQNLDRSRARDLPQITLDASGDATEDVVDSKHVGVYAGFLQHLGPWLAAGARLDYFDPDVDAPDDQQSALTLVTHAYPADPIRLTLAYELRFEEPSIDDNQLWLRAQVKY